MKKMNKNLLREAVKAEFVKQGFDVQEKRGRGLVPGSRLLISKPGSEDEQEVTVRVSTERSLGFSRHSTGKGWKILDSVDFIAGVFPSAKERGEFEMYVLETSTLRPYFERALAELKEQKRAPSPEMPIFVPLDKRSRKNFGHKQAGLADNANPMPIAAAGLQSANSDPEDFYARVKREFAEMHGVNPSDVTIEFRIVK